MEAQIKRFLELKAEIDALEAQAKSLKEEKDALEEILVAHFTENGVQSVRMDGKLVYLHIATFAMTPQGTDAAIEVLKATDYRDLVKPTVNSSALSALVRELKEQDAIPESFMGVIEPGERTSLRIKKAS